MQMARQCGIAAAQGTGSANKQQAARLISNFGIFDVLATLVTRASRSETIIKIGLQIT